MTMDERVIPTPELNPEVEPFFAAAKEGRLLLKRCLSCGEAHHYPRAQCPFCFGDTEWTEASGEGEIYACTVLRRAKVPYAVAYVTLAEGPRMMTNIVNCPQTPQALQLDMAVEVVFEKQTDDISLPLFQPVKG